jgi:hypothetical protein
MDFVNKTAVNIFLFTCKIVNRVKDVYIYLHITNKPFRDAVWYINKLYRTITFQYTEPYKYPWISKSWLTPNIISITERFVFNEQYKTNFDEVFSCIFKTVYDNMNAQYKTFCNDINSNKTGLFIIKLSNEDNDTCYIVSINDQEIPSTIEKSEARFLSIEYKHHEMEHSIELTLDKSWFYTENVLFTPTFVLRSLKYQSKSFFFDMNYKICIMDNNINMIEFGSDKHVVLTKTGYEVVENTVVEVEESDSQMLWREQFELCGQFLNDIS